jgi:hypothetical protein
MRNRRLSETRISGRAALAAGERQRRAKAAKRKARGRISVRRFTGVIYVKGGKGESPKLTELKIEK